MKRIEKLEDKFSSIRNWILLVAGGIIANLVAILAKG